jgi:hypothetical protein
LDAASDVLLGVGLAVGALLVVAALLALAGLEGGLAAWVLRTGERLSGPLTAWVPSSDPGLALAAVLAVAGLAWAALGWLLSRLLRPG